jgi:hypothetical protein
VTVCAACVPLLTENHNLLQQAEYDALREEGGKAAEAAAEALYLLQRDNAIKLRDFIDDYQPEPYGKTWGNDPDYHHIHTKLKEAMLNDEVNVKKMIKLEAGIVDKKKKKKSTKSKSRGSGSNKSGGENENGNA